MKTSGLKEQRSARGSSNGRQLWEPGNAGNGQNLGNVSGNSNTRSSSAQPSQLKTGNDNPEQHFTINVPRNSNVRNAPMYSQVLQGNDQSNAPPGRWHYIPVSDNHLFQNNGVSYGALGRQDFPLSQNLGSLNNVIGNQGGGHPMSQGHVSQNGVQNIEAPGIVQPFPLYHRQNLQNNEGNFGSPGKVQGLPMTSMMQYNGQSTGIPTGTFPSISQNQVRILDRTGTNMYTQ